MKASALQTARDRRRDAIVAVASQVFAEEGYAAASMSSIAARLGGSKGTLYNYFRSKEELFEAQVVQGCTHFMKDAFDLPRPDDRPVKDVLTQLGEGYLTHLFSDWAVRTFRVVVAEAVRSPQLAQIFYEAGPAVGLKRLETYLEEARDRGALLIDDCGNASGEFLTLCRGHLHFVYVLNLEPGPSAASIKTQVGHAVTLFLKSYAA